MYVIKCTISAAFLLLSSLLYAAAPGSVSLAHFESLQRLTIQSDGAESGVQKLQRSTSVVLSFDALGRVFELELQPNNRVMSADSRSDVVAYRGQLTGNADSWARIVIHNGMPSGVIWDGVELFAVEAPGDALVETTAPLIYRLADALIAPGAMTCASEASATSGAATLQKLVGELGGALARAPGAIKELTMVAVADFEFTSDKGGDAGAETAIMNRLNIVDGIFSEQLAVQINVQAIDTFNNAADPFTSTDPGALLDELSLFRSTSPSHLTRGLTHLYTGRELDGTTVGIAWTGALCSDFNGAGLSEGRQGSTFDALIAAHEIGHNFGAPHDGQAGSACVAETGDFLMAPRINMSQQFSACSIAEMEKKVARAACIQAIPAVDMSVSLRNSSTTLLLGADTELDYDVSNNGTLEATNVSAEFTLPTNFALDTVTSTAGTCNNGAGTINCDFGVVAGSSDISVVLAGNPSSTGAATFSASVTSDVDERPTNNQSVLQFVVDPAVDLVVNTPTSNAVLVNSVTTINAMLENQSDLAASGLTLSISFGSGLQANAANWSIGTCTVMPQQVDCQATSLAARATSNLSIDVRGITAGNKNFTVDLASADAEANPGNNVVASTVRVNEPPNKDEGGGAAAPAFLLLLAMSAAIVRRRSCSLG